ncbi:MAG: carbohydrate ABC transporter substrate-binding protein, partial [Rhodobacteraceae bacterium]|nr:carbohydrate ABC transporter substrate-binding protein [Paracoccaceae bacterium]
MSYSKLATASAIAIAATGVASRAQAEDLTLCWAGWDPANALVELSKEFEAQSGHTMNFEFVPWPNFADR